MNLLNFENFSNNTDFNILKNEKIKNDIINQTIKNMIYGSYDNKLYQFMDEIGNYDNKYKDLTNDQLIESEDFKNWLHDDLSYVYEEYIKLFKSFNDKVDIWRTIKVSNKWLNLIKSSVKKLRLGKYWSFDKNASEPHWGFKYNNTIIIHASVDFNKINWFRTMSANMAISTGEEEKEIYLNENTEIDVISINEYANEKEIEFNKNIKFYS